MALRRCRVSGCGVMPGLTIPLCNKHWDMVSDQDKNDIAGAAQAVTWQLADHVSDNDMWLACERYRNAVRDAIRGIHLQPRSQLKRRR